jgi:hypothetical protein
MFAHHRSLVPTWSICADGRKEKVLFDKITSRVAKLAFGLNTDFVDAVSSLAHILAHVSPDLLLGSCKQVLCCHDFPPPYLIVAGPREKSPATRLVVILHLWVTGGWAIKKVNNGRGCSTKVLWAYPK